MTGQCAFGFGRQHYCIRGDASIPVLPSESAIDCKHGKKIHTCGVPDSLERDGQFYRYEGRGPRLIVISARVLVSQLLVLSSTFWRGGAIQAVRIQQEESRGGGRGRERARRVQRKAVCGRSEHRFFYFHVCY